MLDERLYSEACARNQEPILEVLKKYVQSGDIVWEVGCGTGQHAVHFAAHLEVSWIPSDRANHLGSVSSWRRHSLLANLQEPRAFDLMDSGPAVEACDVVFCANVAHIAPWEAFARIVLHANAALRGGGILFLYGPWRFEDRPFAPSNEAFDRSLRARDPAMGIRSFEAFEEEASMAGLLHEETIAMPANNHVLIFRK